MKNLKKKFNLLVLKAKNGEVKFINNRGSMFTDKIMQIGIVVIVGGALLTLLNTLIPGLFTNLVDKIKSVLSIT